jgi:hypothetical protein
LYPFFFNDIYTINHSCSKKKRSRDETSSYGGVKDMFLKLNKEVMLTVGMFSLTIAIILDRFAGTGTIIDFLCGLFTGFSLVMNLGFLIKYRIEKNSEPGK